MRAWLAATLAIILAAAVIAAGVVIVYFHNQPASGPKSEVVTLGGNATVNYIGLFGSGPDEGKVFDTSFWSVATNNASFPKSLEFEMRTSEANYTPLGIYLGNSTPSGGYSLGSDNFVQVVPGFWQGVLGMAPNTTRTIVISPALGYGPTDTACEATVPIIQTLPVMQTVTGPVFSAAFPGITAAVGREFTDPKYGWTDEVFSANASYVTLLREPYVGEVTSPGGWPIEVTAVHSTANGTGTITIDNEIAPSQAGHLLGHDFLGTGPCSASSDGRFIVTAVNLTAGTFTENYNEEVQGQTLIFIITVVDWFPMGTVD